MTETAKLEALTAEAIEIADRLDEYADIDEAEGGTAYVIEAERRAAVLLRALSVSRPAVKGLEWRPYRNGDADAVTPFGVVYSAYASGHWRTNKDPKFKQGGATLETAKAAAQSDFDQRILSSLSPPTGGWKPIESAPRDRTPIIIAVPTKDRDDHIVGEAYFDPEHDDGDWWWAGTGHGDYHGGPISEMNHHLPTHWQPLPSPPEVE